MSGEKLHCTVCNVPGSARCTECMRVMQIVRSEPAENFVLVADGSFPWETKRRTTAGAGLVLARESDEAVIAVCAVRFESSSSDEAEEEAALRALRWAPLPIVWTDSKYAINRLGRGRCKWIPPEMRDPLHDLAHKLSLIGRHGAWSRMEKLWIPGEVW